MNDSYVKKEYIWSYKLRKVYNLLTDSSVKYKIQI